MTTRRSVIGLLSAVPLTACAGTVAAASASGGRSGRSGRPVPPDLRPGGALDRLVAERAEGGEFSGSVLVSHRGRAVLARSYGEADKALSVPNGPGTRFALASVTKLFTAVAVARLVQAGRLSYGDELGTHLHRFPAEIAEQVSIHHLLTHTSGLGDHHSPEYWEIARGWTTAAQVMDGTTDHIRRTAKLAFAPGAGHAYSNSGFHLLGAIVAKVSGTPFHDHLHRHVFQAAGMRDTGYVTKPEWRHDRGIAHPYRTLPSGERVDALEDHLFIGTPAGDAFSTCRDMVRFAHALLDDRLLEPAFRELTLSGKVPMGPPKGPPPGGRKERRPADPPPSPSRPAFQAYGPIAGLVGGGWAFGHGGGSSNGASTSFEAYPDRDLVTAFLSNYQAGTVEPIASLARRIIAESP